jgi:anti-sigma B factor antagonist
MDNLKLSITILPGRHEGQRVLALSGPLTLTTLFEFQDAVRAESPPITIIDLSAVPFVDSAGLGSIINAHVSCAKSGRRLALAGVPDRVRTLLQITGVQHVFAVFPNAQEAQEKLAP